MDRKSKIRMLIAALLCLLFFTWFYFDQSADYQATQKTLAATKIDEKGRDLLRQYQIKTKIIGGISIASLVATVYLVVGLLWEHKNTSKVQPFSAANAAQARRR